MSRNTVSAPGSPDATASHGLLTAPTPAPVAARGRGAAGATDPATVAASSTAAAGAPTVTALTSPAGQVNAGTLSVSPATVLVSPLLGGTLTLTADGGPVSWSISEPGSLLGELAVSPESGSLAAGASVTVSITVSGLVSLGTQLTVEPGGHVVTVVLGLG